MSITSLLLDDICVNSLCFACTTDVIVQNISGLMESTIIEDILETFEQKFYDHYPKSLQNNQVMPPTTSSTVLNIVESPAAATIRLQGTGSSRSKKKGWKFCKKFVRELSICVCVCISLIIILPIIFRSQLKTTQPPTLGPPTPPFFSTWPTSIPMIVPPPPPFSTTGRGWVTVPPPPAHF